VRIKAAARTIIPAIPVAPSLSPRSQVARMTPVSGSSSASSAAVLAAAVRRPRKYSV
jgi:hypothetical protein